MSLKKSIVLCGFMGSGKSTLGETLSRHFTVPFVDIDGFIEGREGMTVLEIFKNLGEPEFREREHAAVLELAKMRGIVLAAGGGALVFERNAAALRKTGVILFLNASFRECYRRVENSDRPLVRSNTRDSLEELYLSRQDAYRRLSDLELCADPSKEEVAAAAIKLLKMG